jgi:dienelactone hydrolase
MEHERMGQVRISKFLIGPSLIFFTAVLLQAEVRPSEALLYFDFAKGISDLSFARRSLRMEGARWGDLSHDPMLSRHGSALEFTNSLQRAEVELNGALDGIPAMTVGGWFYCRRKGEQVFFSRGLPEIGVRGTREFPPRPDWVNFVLGTDERGFFLGTINGNGQMPFPYVTVNEIGINTWNQLVVIKTAEGGQKFFHNGTLVHTDRESVWSPRVIPFRDTAPGEPARLSMPMGGLIGEAWIFPRELSAEEILKDYQAKKNHYQPALPGEQVLLREMNAHPADGLWKEPLTAQSWPALRRRILQGVTRVLGNPPIERVPLDAKVISNEDMGTYIRRKVSIQVQPDDRMPAYLLIPKKFKGRIPAVICFYGTTSGAGKDTTVGISGRKSGTPPQRNAAFAIDIVEAGFVAFAGDYLRDGERISPGRAPYDTTDFYKKFPDWSIHGKDAWDTSRAIDYLQTLDFVDSQKIGMLGHSYGGHSTIFTTALDPRIKVAVANGPVSDFLHHGLHWAVPKGGRNSQSMPALRPYVLDQTLPIPVKFYEFTALIAPRPLLIGQAVGERRPMEEENYAAVSQVYRCLGYRDRVRYHWYAGDHDFPPAPRKAAVDWFRRWFF